jgi:HAE1 family hydrophobic/amphiphilic exporter-1
VSADSPRRTGNSGAPPRDGNSGAPPRDGNSGAHSRDGATRVLAELLARPVSLAIFVATLVVLGVFSLLRLPVALLPTLERPRLEIALEAKALDRASLVQDVVAPLERRLLPLPGVATATATVDDGRALLRLEGEWQADTEKQIVEVERLLASQPAGRLELAATRAAPPDPRPVLRLAVLAPLGEQPDLVALAGFADSVLLPELGRLPGAGELRRRGGARRLLLVEPRFSELAARGLPVSALADRLRGTGRRETFGLVRQGGDRRPLLLGQEVRQRADLESLSLGQGLLLRDLAGLREELVADGSLAFFRDQEAVLVDVFRSPGANAVVLAREARELLARLAARPALPSRILLVADTSGEVVDSLAGLGSSLLLGLLLGALVLRAGLGRWRPTLSLMVVVPASILASFAGFYAFGVPLDVVSLAGLALASGMLVDSSIVVLEAIATARAAGAADPRLEGTRQVALPLLASFATTAVVFLPLLYLEGLARAFFGAQAFAIASSLGLSLVLSLTLTPLLSSRGGRLEVGDGGSSFGLEGYRRRLAAVLAKPAPALLITLLLVAAGVPALVLLPKTLMPEGLRRNLEVELSFGRGDEDTRRRQLGDLVARIAQATPAPFAAELALPPRLAGGGQGEAAAAGRAYLHPFTEEGRGKIELTFADAASLAAAEPAIRAACEAVPGLRAELRRERGALAAFVDELGRGLELEVLAASEERAEHLAAAAAAALAEQGIASRAEQAAGGEKLELRFDPSRSPEERQAAEKELQGLLGGELLGYLQVPGVEGELRLSAPQSPLELLPVPTLEGRMLPLGALGRLAAIEKPKPLERRGGRSSRLLRVEAELARKEKVEQALAKVPRLSGEEIALVGRSREMARAFGQLELALGLGLLLVFLTIAALYESLRLPLVVIATVPCAVAGAFLTLLIFGSSLDVFSFLGLLLLAGIVVNNAIVLLDRAEEWRRRGESATDAVKLAAAERYRPILMTTATTLLGLLPMALLGGEGAELRRSLALALFGGMATSWMAVLFVMPLLYVAASSRQESR